MNFDPNGVQCRPVTLDWPAIEPQDGVFDEAAIACARQELQALTDQGARPLLIFYGSSCPQWLEERGAFAKSDNITCFLRFVHKMVESVGDLASEYITFNEPNLYAYKAYLEGAWPPGRKSLLDMARVMTNLTAAHIEAYGLIRKTRLKMGFKDTRVGTALHLRAFAPLDPLDPVHRFWASRTRQLFQGSLTRAMCTGRVSIPVGRHPSIIPGQYCDFHGVSYSGRSVVSGPGGRVVNEPGSPQDMAAVCQEICKLLPRPIRITACPSGEPSLCLEALEAEGMTAELCCLPYPEESGGLHPSH